MQRLTFFALLAASIAFGCRATKLVPDDVVGTWSVERDSRARLSEVQRKASLVLVVNADGTFSATVPADLLYDAPEVRDGVVSGTGAWRLYDDYRGKRSVQLVFRWLAPEGDLPYGTFLEAHGTGARTVLFYTRWDPDEGNRVEFEKTR